MQLSIEPINAIKKNFQKFFKVRLKLRLRDKILFIVAAISAVTILAMVSTAQPRPTDNTTIQGKWFVNAATWGDTGDSSYPIEEIRNWCWTFEEGKFEWNGAPPGKRNVSGEKFTLQSGVKSI
jgi:hypothetical protein